MNWKNKKKVLGINALLVATLYSLVSLNKEFLRPALVNSDLLIVLTGCFPNFIAALFISLASVSGALIRKLNNGRLFVYLFSFAVFIILMIEEIKPMWGASEHYDLFDIIASALGSLIAIGCYELLSFLSKRKLRRHSE